MPGKGNWTDERVSTLKKLWAEGLSCSQIAMMLGEVTRNAVIGKVVRLGLSGRATTPRQNSVRARPVRVPRRKPRQLSAFNGLWQGPSPEGFPTEELVIPISERKTIATLEDCNCRWPIGDPQHPDFHFCGREKYKGTPYCGFHAHKAFLPPQSMRKREQEAAVLEERQPVVTG